MGLRGKAHKRKENAETESQPANQIKNSDHEFLQPAITSENTALKKKVNELLVENNNLKYQIVNIQKENNNLLLRAESILLRERDALSRSTEWEKIIDEIAHTINNNTTYAANALRPFIDSDPAFSRSFYYIKEIHDLLEMILYYLKKDEIFLDAGNDLQLNLGELFTERLGLLKEIIPSLRLNTLQHRDNLLLMSIPLDCETGCLIDTDEKSLVLLKIIFMDILKNAVRNTNRENPQVSISITKGNNDVNIRITNNNLIDELLCNWLNDPHSEEPSVHKSSMVGLRIILKWIKFLNIGMRTERKEDENRTEFIITLPQRLKIGK